MQNPFVRMKSCRRRRSWTRVVELDRLVADLTAAQKIFLISPRR